MQHILKGTGDNMHAIPSARARRRAGPRSRRDQFPEPSLREHPAAGALPPPRAGTAALRGTLPRDRPSRTPPADAGPRRKQHVTRREVRTGTRVPARHNRPLSSRGRLTRCSGSLARSRAGDAAGRTRVSSGFPHPGARAGFNSAPFSGANKEIRQPRDRHVPSDDRSYVAVQLRTTKRTTKQRRISNDVSAARPGIPQTPPRVEHHPGLLNYHSTELHFYSPFRNTSINENW